MQHNIFTTYPQLKTEKIIQQHRTLVSRYHFHNGMYISNSEAVTHSRVEQITMENSINKGVINERARMNSVEIKVHSIF